jgi:hypothetical protein
MTGMGNKRTSSSCPSREAESLYSMPDEEVQCAANPAVELSPLCLAADAHEKWAKDLRVLGCFCNLRSSTADRGNSFHDPFL